MHYKTIVLALLQQRTEMHEELRRSRKLLLTLEYYARELKKSHEELKDLLSAVPGNHPSQISSRAMELAIKELEDRLPPRYARQTGRWTSTKQWRSSTTFTRRAPKLITATTESI